MSNEDFVSNALRILVADELDIVRDAFRFLLTSRAGWQVCAEAADGREALDMALQLRPGVVVLDQNIPVLDSLEVTGQIRKALPDAEIVLVTLRDSKLLAEQARAAGASGLILKAKVKSELIPAVEAVAQHKQFLQTRPASSPGRVVASTKPSAEPRRPQGSLTAREREIVAYVAQGKTSKEIGKTLGRSFKTVEAHRANIIKKLGFQSVSDLVRYAVRHQIIPK